MRPLADFAGERIDGLLFDLDDTLLTHGVLTRAAYGALWDLHEAGVRLVAVTGRPSGWAEVLVRQWPIDGAVAENGAVFVVRSGAGVDVLAGERGPLDALVLEVKRKMPHVHLADDVHARRTDVTWDIGERHRVPEDEICALGRLVVAAGARTTRSTVHLHATFARDDKASGAMRFLHDRFGEDPGRAVNRWAFVGDSANDAACFAAMRLTFGVANVRAFASRMSIPPRWVANGERGEGFVEIARSLLRSFAR